MKAILIFFLCLIKIMSNLVLGGDFQYYRRRLIYSYTSLNIRLSVSFNSSQSCGWYNPPNLGVQIINHTRVLTTYCANLKGYQYRICQNFSFVAGGRYQLSYDLYNPFYIARANVTVTLGLANISSFILSGSNLFGNHYSEFIAPSSGFYSLCFSS